MFHDRVKQIFERVGVVRRSNLIPLCIDLMKEIEKSKYVVGLEKKEAVLQAMRDNVGDDDERLVEMCDTVLPYVIDLVVFLAKHKRILKDFTTKHCGC